MPPEPAMDAGRNDTIPLVVALHGYLDVPYEPAVFPESARAGLGPFYFLAPQTTAASWSEVVEEVTAAVEAAVRAHPIDPGRLYLLGFSMGGSGTYQVANRYLQRFGTPFAAIVRIAGQSESQLIPGSPTAVWHHIGTRDTPLRQTMARRCLRDRRSAHPDHRPAATRQDEVGGFRRVTKALAVEGREVALLSRYHGLGHDGAVPLQDPEVFRWLFRQRLKFSPGEPLSRG